MLIEPVLRFALLGAAALAAACSDGSERQAAPEPPLAGTFQVGRLEAACVEEPCPQRGIFQLGSISGLPVRRTESLPPLVTDAETRRRLQKAWDDYDCLLARGTFDGKSLTVQQIEGEC